MLTESNLKGSREVVGKVIALHVAYDMVPKAPPGIITEFRAWSKH